jgi:hypothetical protein
MPLCPQITNTPITVTLTADFTVTNVIPVLPANTEQLAATDAQVAIAIADAAAAAAAAATSLQVSSNTIVNASNQITAINGTGITVYSGGSATSGARVVLNSAGLAGFNSSGTSTFAIDSSNGNVSVTGTVNAGAGYFGTSTDGFSINSTGLVGVGTGLISGGAISGSTITGGTVQTSSGAAAVILNGSSNAIQFKAASSVVGNMVPLNIGGSTYGVIMHYGATADGSGATYPQSYVGSGSAQIAYSSGIYVSAFSGGVTIAASGQTITFANQAVASGTLTSNGELFAAGHSTTANAANGFIFTTGGRIARSTASSQRYKENVTDLWSVPELDPKKLLQVPVRAFTYKENYLKNDDRTGVLIPGLIAEEVDAIYPLAADYADGNVENINDRAILINLLALVQDLYKEIDILKGA